MLCTKRRNTVKRSARRVQRQRRLWLETLESRQLLASSSSATWDVSSGNLTVTDTVGTDNQLTVSVVAGNLVITDANAAFVNPPGIGELSNSDKTLTIPLGDVTGQLIVYGNGGDDSLTVDFGVVNPIPIGGLTFHGVAGVDTLTVQGDTGFAALTYDATGIGAGTLQFSDVPLITFDGLEPVVVNPVSGTITINIDPLITVPGLLTSTFTSPGPSLDNQVAFSPGGLESLEFNNPTNALIVNGRPNADDTITFASLHAGFNAALTVDGQGGTDTVSLNTGDNVGCAVSIVSPSTINLGPSTIAGALTVTASGDISISGTVRSSSVTLITTSGAIKDNNNSNPDIWATDAVLTAVNGIGAGSIGAGSDTTDTTTNPLNYLDTRVSRLDVNNNVYNIPTADGQVQIANDGALQLIDLDATKAMIINGLNPGTIRANSPETISTSITHNTSFTYMAGDDVIAIDDNLTINNDATVTLDSYSATLTFQAGDDILFGDATTTPTTTGQINTVKLGCSVSLTADHDGGTDPPVTDGYSGGVFQAATQTVASVTTTDLIITAGGGVGLPADLSVSPSLPPVPLGISVGTLDVENTTSGDILISQNTTGSLSVARLKNEAPGGWIQLWASGSTTVEGDPGVSGVSTNGGGVLLAMSSGENPSLAVNAPITTNGGSVDLEADGSVTSTIDGVITTTVQGTSGGNSGDVTVIASLGTQEILDLAGDIDTHGASNTTGVGGNGGSLGFSPAVYIRNISGAVIVSGLITTTGGSGTPTGGNGGEVALFTDSGSISVNEPALITTSGGWGSTTGGDAGGIYVNVYGEGYAATVSVPLTAVGGQAGTGDGGTGGHVQVTAADGSVTVSTITASGGDSTSGTGGSAYGWQLMPGAFQEAVSLTTAGNLGDVTIKGTVTALGGNWGQSLQGNDGEVYVSAAGGLVDGLATPDLLDVWAGRLTANATTGVGLANPLDTQVTTLNVTNSIFGFGSGNIDINEFDAVDVFQLTNDVDVDQLTGSIRLVAGGTITLLTKANPPLPLYTPPYPTYQASGVQATDGNVTLTAGVTAGVNADGVLNNVVTLKARTSTTTSTAAVTISAERDVLGDAAGDITTADGNVTITADADGSGLGGNNDGTIQLRGDITALGGSVTLSLADCDGWLGDATVVADDGRILSALDITKNGLGALRLNRAGNTYTGLTTVNDGTLIVNGTLFDSVAAGGVVVTDNAILGGNGTINAVVLVKAFGTLDPGDCLANGAAPRCSPQPGKLTVTSVPPEDGSTVQFEFDATFRVQLNGLIPGQATSGPPVDGGYDQLVVDGTVNLGGTTPPGANGATLQTSVGVGFVMPVGAAFRVINNDSTELVSNQFNDLPEESFFYAGSYVMNISYQSGLNNNDVTLTHPGRYDFNAYLPDTDPYYYESVGPMYPGNTAQAYSESTGVGWSTTSPNVLPQVTGRGASEGDSLGRNTYPVGASPSGTPVRLLRDLHFTYDQATFQVDAVTKDTMTNVPLLYQVLVTSGDYGLVHEHSEFTVSGNSFDTKTSPYTSPPQEAVTDLIQFKQLVFRDVQVRESVANPLTGQLQVKMAYTGTNTWWSAAINAVDIRPVTSVGQISIARVDTLSLDVPVPLSTGVPVSADGLTKDYYIGTNAVRNAVITVTTTNGTVLPLTPLGAPTTDLDSYLLGVQVLSDANGQFQFQIQRPSGTGGTVGVGTAMITAWELEGRSYGQVGQRYNQDYLAVVPKATPITHRWFDFNTSISPTTTGYIGVLPNAVYSSATGYGWESPMMAQDRVQGPDDVRRDFQWGQFGKFQIEVTPNVSYKLQALFGEVIPGQWPPGPPVIGEGSNRDPEDPGTTATLITVTPEGGDPVTLYRPLVNNFQPIDFTGFSTDEVLEITISVSGGVYEYFAINALAIWQRDDAAPAKFQLLAADAPADQPLGAVLTQTALGPIVDEARARWVAFGLSADQSVTLQAMAYRVADLPSPALAEIDTTANSMLIDRDAVGRGWFIDPTPWEDSEYVLGQPPPGVDLLTVVMHEMGHALGYQDLYSSQFPQALMALQLMPEQARRAPTGPLVTGTNPIQPNDVNGDGNVTPTDVLLLINRIDASDGPLTTVAPDGSPMFYDVSADNFLSALDVLRVVNYLNTPAVAQLSAPVLDSPSSTGPLVVAPEIVPSAPAGSSPTAVGPPARATDQVVLPAAGTQSPVPVWPAAEGEDWLDDLAADVQAAQADELATDAIFQELGKI